MLFPFLSDCDSDDLASVRQILDTTVANPFEAYFSKHDDDGMPLSGQTNGYNSSPSEYRNDGPQIKDEPRDLEDSDYAGVVSYIFYFQLCININESFYEGHSINKVNIFFFFLEKKFLEFFLQL